MSRRALPLVAAVALAGHAALHLVVFRGVEDALVRSEQARDVLGPLLTELAPVEVPLAATGFAVAAVVVAVPRWRRHGGPVTAVAALLSLFTFATAAEPLALRPTLFWSGVLASGAALLIAGVPDLFVPAGAAAPGDRLTCERVLPDATVVYRDTVDVGAPPALVYRWLLQLDTGGELPARLVAGLGHPSIGQPMMGPYRLRSFRPHAELTLATDDVPRASVTFRVRPIDAGHGSRLDVELVSTAGPPFRHDRRPWCDVAELRRRLPAVKRLAERDSRLTLVG